MNKQKGKKSQRELPEMLSLPFISDPRVLKLRAGCRSFFLLVEKMLWHIKKPLAFSHSLL